MLTTPSKDKYDEKISIVRDLFSSLVPRATTAVGSVIYEFIIRPISIIYAAVEDEIQNLYIKYSLRYLSTSDNTEEGIADYVLSNYFVERNTGSKASGALTIYSAYPNTSIPEGSLFVAGGVTLSVTRTTNGIYPSASEYVTNQDVVYTDAYSLGDDYCFNVQVESVDNINNVIPDGSPAESLSYIPGLSKVTVSSTISGGSTGETDSEMVARARYSVCSWSGSNASIHKLLNTSNIQVYSSMSFDDRDREMTRTSGSPLFIGTGGMIDTYVKTCKYPKKGTATVEALKANDSFTADVTNVLPRGFYYISDVRNRSGHTCSFSVSWGSSDPVVTQKGARLSSLQTAVLNIQDADPSPSAVYYVSYTYMPYIQELQSYMDRSDVRVIGQDILIKAAVPAVVSVRASISDGISDLTQVKELIRDYINNTQVGQISLDISDINSIIAGKFSGSHILNPVFMTCSVDSMIMSEGYSESSTNGIISCQTIGGMSSRIQFMCASDQEVAIE